MGKKMLALKGNATTTGGVVLSGDTSLLDQGQPLALHMGLASCARCDHNGTIIGTGASWGLGRRSAVRDGDLVMCHCPPGTNRVIARSTLYDGE